MIIKINYSIKNNENTTSNLNFREKMKKEMIFRSSLILKHVIKSKTMHFSKTEKKRED